MISVIALIAVLCTAFAACSPSENNANTGGLDSHQSAEVCNHAFGEVEAKIIGTETDCVNQVRKCSACSFEEVVEKGEHVYEEVEIAENSATYKCTICNHTYTALVENSDINSDIDDESSDESSDPESGDTSNDESGDESDESSDVESIPEDNITSTDHEFEYITKTEVAPTCTKDGYYVWTCSCGDTKTEASGKKATGHKYGNRYSQVIKVADIPQMFADAGFDMSKYDVNKIHFILVPEYGRIVPNRITWAT